MLKFLWVGNGSGKTEETGPVLTWKGVQSNETGREGSRKSKVICRCPKGCQENEKHAKHHQRDASEHTDGGMLWDVRWTKPTKNGDTKNGGIGAGEGGGGNTWVCQLEEPSEGETMGHESKAFCPGVWLPDLSPETCYLQCHL